MDLSARLVAHRGYMDHYPENTLCGLQAAIDAGAKLLEFDIQLTRDRVPVLLHDDTLERTTGASGTITQMTYQEVADYSAHYPERFDQRFYPEPIPSLKQVVAQLNTSPDVMIFVEVKRQSLDRFGIAAVVDSVFDDMENARFDWALIAFNRQALEYTRNQYGQPVGWALRHYDDHSRRTAQKFVPEYLFCNVAHLDGNEIWPGPWQWCTYDIRDPELAVQLFKRGSNLIETGCIGELLQGLEAISA